MFLVPHYRITDSFKDITLNVSAANSSLLLYILLSRVLRLSQPVAVPPRRESESKDGGW